MGEATRLWVALVMALVLALVLAGCGDDGAHTSEDAGGAPPVEDAGGMEPQADGGGGPAPMAQGISRDELERVIQTLAADDMNGRDEGTPGGIAARTLLVEELTRCGIEPNGTEGFEQPITTGSGVNLVGRIGGTDPARSNRHLLLSAHYDHIGDCGGAICNGADDNAAGVSIVLNLACVLAADPPDRSVLVAFWDAEEPPTFLSSAMGSAFFVANPTVPLDEIDVAVVLDLVGSDLWPSFEGHFYLGAELSPQVAAAVDAAEPPEGLPVYRAGLHMVEITPFGEQPWSDYHAFRQSNVPVLFLSNGQNQRYHSPEDEMAHINLPKVEREARHLLDVVRALGEADATPMFSPGGADYLSDARNLERVLEAATGDDGMADALGLTATSHGKLEQALQAVRGVRMRLEGGGTASGEDIGHLRAGTQRVMCYASPTYDEDTCNIL